MNNSRDDPRPDPDQLLSEIQRQDARGNSGRLKVFLGMVAGVGKTYAMLQAAHQLRAQGEDVVVGWVETHGRRETAGLLDRLEIMPRLQQRHRGVELEEMDLDAVIARRPKTVLVDELAHTNAPGSRHTKRFLDVLEILRAGIDVFTTVNVQHLESRVGTVHEITGVTVHETVPDSVLDHADEVVLIDLAPDELLKRLKEGKVYPPERAETASANFFQKGNLTALREMALRLAAERVDRDLRSFKVLHGIESAWKSGSRLMVAIYASPYSETLIRWTRRLADLMDATWLGVYVEHDEALSDAERALLTKNMALVTQLGGEVVSTRDSNPVDGLLRSARQNNVTQVIVGKTQRSFLNNIRRGGSIVGRLIAKSGDIDVYAVSAAGGVAATHRGIRRKFKANPLPWDEAGWAFAWAIVTWIAAAGLAPFIGYVAVGIIFLLSVTVAGLFLSRTSVFGLAVVFAVLHNYFFIPPVNTFEIKKSEDVLTLVMYFVAAAALGHLTTKLKGKERVLSEREERAVLLFNLTRSIASAKSIDEVAEAGLNNVRQAFKCDAVLLLPSGGSESRLLAHPASSFLSGDKELGVAEWVQTHGKAAGKFTDTLPASSALYLPVTSREATLGVLGIELKGKSSLNTEDLTLAETFARQIASGVERELFHRKSHDFEVVVETQRLYKTLLDSVSHELKTPLAAIKGSASALLDPLTTSEPGAALSLAAEIMTGTERLQRLVENLLDMTRIESGMLRPRSDLCDVEDVVGAVLRRIDPLKGCHPIAISFEEMIPPVVCDQVLLVQAMTNIVHNALVYTTPETAIEIGVKRASEDQVAFMIRDHGGGLPNDPARVLEKFFRGAPEKTGGVGLGLSIALGFIELQKGRLVAESHPEGGAQFTVFVPAGASDEQ